MPSVTKEQAHNDIIESIAQEEVGIAHLLNAEAEKIKTTAILMGKSELSPDEVIDIQKSVIKTLQTAIKMQILLEFKLEATLDAHGCNR